MTATEKHDQSGNTGQCQCGKVQFAVQGSPIMRAFCHCTICQTYNNAPFADITLFRAQDIDLPGTGDVAFRAYQSPPILKRGKCLSCGGPALERLSAPLLPKLVIVPTANLSANITVPEPSLHVFYHRRIADSDDNLPKYSGYLASQLAFGKQLIAAMRSARG